MLQAGDSAPPETTLWIRPRETVTLGELAAAGPILLVFYLFDWSAT